MNHFFEKFWFGWSLAAVLGLLLMGTIASGQPANPDPSNWLAVGPQELQRDNFGSIFPGPTVAPGLHMVWVAAKQNDTGWPYSTWRSYGPFEATAGRSYLITVQSNGVPLVGWKAWSVRANNDLNPGDRAAVFYLNQTASEQIFGITVVPALDSTPRVVMRVEDLLTAADEARNDCHFKTYDVLLTAGQRYAIDLESKEFDTCVKLLNAASMIVAFDEGGMGEHPRIVFEAATTGIHRIMATSAAEHATGAFALVVREEER